MKRHMLKYSTYLFPLVVLKQRYNQTDKLQQSILVTKRLMCSKVQEYKINVIFKG